MAFLPFAGTVGSWLGAGAATSAAAAAIGGTAMVAAASIGTMAYSMSQAGKGMPGFMGMPEVPKAQDAAQLAAQKMSEDRRARILAGGLTDVTGGQNWPQLLGSTQKKTLLG